MSIGTVHTHIDFDGIASAAILANHYAWKGLRFTTPKQIVFDAVSESDAVLDLPFTRTCAIWFDHHEQNFHEPSLRGLDPSTIDGKREAAPSCARVILRFYDERGVVYPRRFLELAEEVDRFDSMLFDSVESWQRVTPGKVVNDSLGIPDESPRSRDEYFHFLVEDLAGRALADVAENERVRRRFQEYQRVTEKNRSLMHKIVRFHPKDRERRILIMDFTPLKFQPFVDKKLIFADHPGVEYLLALYPYYKNNTKTNSISLSIARNFLLKPVEKTSPDWGEFFAEREMGGGHRDAAGGRIDSSSKADQEKKLDLFMADALAYIARAERCPTCPR